ncbi:prolyl oligopeptidase family serine peptidase [Streptomyces yaizuensis]|uniref:Prolyl oligopeptidase family serine peptidase n=1 Tax=Streptomyces yaizuensis TaxID=2989713 RepID=A0ABQ5NW82_9ACTN|nr:prolyl oligopeptidase family serine peptidase [Streptomyces sp. YSPA8]GLF94464.1 prolyl oligopeptidase family serine peptidase [Streptomyces sp. YSPA8]
MASKTQLSFPRQYARTQRYTLGSPRSFTVSPDGSRVIFLRTASGVDRNGRLWVLDLANGTEEPRERLVADPEALLSGAEEQLSAEEQARRERARDGSSGIVGYAVDAAAELAAFTLSGRLFAAGLKDGDGWVRELTARGPAVDPHPSPDGRFVAYVGGGALRVTPVTDDAGAGAGDRALAEPEDELVTYGLAEFVAAEDMGRQRGYWWSPESDRLLVARVDEREVRRWWIADPAHPEREPREVRYPTAGTANADVRLFVVTLGGERTEVVWDRAEFPYLARVHWSAAGAPIVLVQTRDQRTLRWLAVDPGTGATRTVHADEDENWLDLFHGVPAWTPDGRLVRIADEGGARVLAVGDRVLTGDSLQIHMVLDVGADDVLVTAAAGAGAAEPEIGEIHVLRVGDRGVERVSRGPGVHTAVRGGPVTVLSSARLDISGTATEVLRDGAVVARIASYAESPVLHAAPRIVAAGVHRIPCAVLLPRDYQESDGPLPVLMDPYGGPRARRVLASQNVHLTPQFLADQGFAVVVADGRGTPGPSPAWEKAVRDNFVLTLDDQIEALHALADSFPLDLGRVGIRGWSYGGYLAAMAVLRRPDVFHTAIVGAPVTDQRMYDTHYTERYLGDPALQPEVYERHALVTEDGLVGLENPARPMMLIHGLADDNVVAAHTLRLSSALLAAGREHEVLPLSGVTHMTPQEQVAENLLLLQVEFLKRTLANRVPDPAE